MRVMVDEGVMITRVSVPFNKDASALLSRHRCRAEEQGSMNALTRSVRQTDGHY
jgi:hypothetical protein